MLKKIAVPSLLLVLLLSTAIPMGAQTRPRRVTGTSSSSTEETTPTRETTREAPPRRRGRSWMRILLEDGIMDSCTPSRERVGAGRRGGL
ncbi:MAG: hypothetical protein M3362_15235 [Acidobacteriota bacterium]|nr:hypothetical protein [Acidobacteriota bacterium]